MQASILLGNFFLAFVVVVHFRKFGLPYLGKAAATARAELSSPTSACCIFACFRNPPNSDMDYRIFNVCACSFLCVRIHTGVGYTNSVSTHFWVRGKNSLSFLCAPDRILTRVMECEVWRSTNWATPPPQLEHEVLPRSSLRWHWCQITTQKLWKQCLKQNFNHINYVYILWPSLFNKVTHSIKTVT